MRRQEFHFGAWVFDVDAAQRLLVARPRRLTNLLVQPWACAYGLGDGRMSLLMPEGLDAAYAMTTDLTVPMIVATTQAGPLLIDGVHRLYRAHTESVEMVPALVLTEEETLRIRR